MNAATVKQRRVLDYIRVKIRTGGPPPCVREIADHFGYHSTRAARDHLCALEKKGYIWREAGKARSIRLLDTDKDGELPTIDIPVLGQIPAGAPFDEEQCTERIVRIDVHTLGFSPSSRVFALVVQGDSMTDRGIFDGDVVIVDREREPRDGDIVAALIDNECALKTLVINRGNVFLRPENPVYSDLVPIDELLIQGVARTVIRNLG